MRNSYHSEPVLAAVAGGSGGDLAALAPVPCSLERAHSLAAVAPEDDGTVACEYEEWRARHPCLLSSFGNFQRQLAGRRLAVFLDYDGTLTPIVSNPDDAVMSQAMRDAVRRVAGMFPTAIISGRGREKVEAFVQLPELYYAGSHGMDIVGPRGAALGGTGCPCGGGGGGGGAGGSGAAGSGGGSEGGGGGWSSGGGAGAQGAWCSSSGGAGGGPAAGSASTGHGSSGGGVGSSCGGGAAGPGSCAGSCGGVGEPFSFQAAAEFRPLIDSVYQQLRDSLASIPGASVEHNKFCVSAHFRNCHPDSWQRVVSAVDAAVAGAGAGRLHVTRGRKVLEVRPTVDWDKGSALLHLLEALGLARQPDVVALYLGDDKTDEDAFAALARAGAGAGVLVSTVPKPTAAAFTLRDPPEVLRLLHRLLEYGGGDGNGWRAFKGACNGWAPAAAGAGASAPPACACGAPTGAAPAAADAAAPAPHRALQQQGELQGVQQPQPPPPQQQQQQQQQKQQQQQQHQHGPLAAHKLAAADPARLQPAGFSAGGAP